jgi:DNA-3-methyladenine glycosylase I
MAILGVDGKMRCFGGSAAKEFYGVYHDKEWCVPVHDDRLLFEMLILEGAQAGLSWETVLKKRKSYQDAFYQFDPVKVAAIHDEELHELCNHPGIIRNRLKIFSTRQNALIFLKIQEEFGSFDRYLWAYVNGSPIIHHWDSLRDAPTTTPESTALSQDLKKRGMNFVGSTIMYAYMQAVGLVTDHIKSCWCYPNQAHAATHLQ